MKSSRWTLKKLIDFESTTSEEREAIPSPDLCENIRNLKGDVLARKRQGLLWWTETQASQHHGNKTISAFVTATFFCCLVAFFSAAGTAWGCFQYEHNGLDVVLFLALTLFLPWLIFGCGLFLMVMRRHLTTFNIMGSLLIVLTKRWIPDSVRVSMSEVSTVLAWRLSRYLQAIAICFHLGAASALAWLISFRHIGFYWESTTAHAIENILTIFVKFSSMPWAKWLPDAVPDVHGSRWTPEQSFDLTNQTAWWPYLVMCLVIWGIVPRVLLSLVFAIKEQAQLKSLSFQAPHHRKLWRALDGVRRSEPTQGPLDGALVIDVGGIHPDQSLLRPFLLQHLRMNPVAWERIGVIDASQSTAAHIALRNAPAGLVLVVESWSLSIPEMQEILKKIRSFSAEKRIVILCLCDPTNPQREEQQQWQQFADGVNDAHLELCFYPPIA
jgi:Protein of unknown function (DUF2868)